MLELSSAPKSPFRAAISGSWPLLPRMSVYLLPRRETAPPSIPFITIIIISYSTGHRMYSRSPRAQLRTRLLAHVSCARCWQSSRFQRIRSDCRTTIASPTLAPHWTDCWGVVCSEKSLPLYWPITRRQRQFGYYCDPESVSLQFSSYRQPWKFADGI